MSRRACCYLMITILIISVAAACEPDLPDPVDEQDLIAMGEPIYAEQCQGCHGDDGMGRRFLAGSDFVMGDPEPVIDLVLRGRGGMPPFGGQLDDQQIAAVISYIRSTWGNEAPVVQPEEVSALR